MAGCLECIHGPEKDVKEFKCDVTREVFSQEEFDEDCDGFESKRLDEPVSQPSHYTSPPSGQRGACLLEAHKIINGERADMYGAPEDSFQLIADKWTTTIKAVAMRCIRAAEPDMSPEIVERMKTAVAVFTLQDTDAGLMLAEFKIARELIRHKPDNIVDACGYLGCAGSIYEREEQRRREAEDKR